MHRILNLLVSTVHFRVPRLNLELFVDQLMSLCRRDHTLNIQLELSDHVLVPDERLMSDLQRMRMLEVDLLASYEATPILFPFELDQKWAVTEA